MIIDKDLILVLVAAWGALLSTVLATIKLIEVWNARRRIEISLNFAGLPEIGNVITIRNLSATPFTITYWELQFCERRKLFWVPYSKQCAEYDFYDRLVKEHSRTSLEFRDEYHFAMGEALVGNRLYIVLNIAGKSKPSKYLVWK